MCYIVQYDDIFVFLVNPMQLLGNTLMRYKTFKDRQNHMNELLDFLSFNYPDAYNVLFKEMKKREIESNDPCKITQWTHSLASNSYVKLHGALILVKNHNILAKEMYLVVLERMLYQTIENRTYIKESMKICCLIEKTKTLSIIHQSVNFCFSFFFF